MSDEVIRAVAERDGVIGLVLYNGFLEPSWEQVSASAAEIMTLQTLETTVAERAIAVRAESLAEVRAKLAIWRTLAPGAEDGNMRTPRNRLILSIEEPLRRMASDIASRTASR